MKPHRTIMEHLDHTITAIYIRDITTTHRGPEFITFHQSHPNTTDHTETAIIDLRGTANNLSDIRAIGSQMGWAALGI